MSSKIKFHNSREGICASFTEHSLDFILPSDFEDIEEAEDSFLSLLEEYEGGVTPKNFIAIAFHTIQQMGGQLYLNSKRLSARRVEQTSGNPEDLVGKVFYNESKIYFQSLLEDYGLF